MNAPRYLIAPVGGIITVATLEEAIAHAREWAMTRIKRTMVVYQLTEIRTMTAIPPPPPPITSRLY